jgi:hypothetical protein
MFLTSADGTEVGEPIKSVNKTIFEKFAVATVSPLLEKDQVMREHLVQISPHLLGSY